MIFPACLEPYWPSASRTFSGEVVRDGLAQEQGLGLVLALLWELASVSYMEFSVTALDS